MRAIIGESGTGSAAGQPWGAIRLGVGMTRPRDRAIRLRGRAVQLRNRAIRFRNGAIRPRDRALGPGPAGAVRVEGRRGADRDGTGNQQQSGGRQPPQLQ